MGGLWQIDGLSKEIEASVCGYGRSVDAMRCDDSFVVGCKFMGLIEEELVED